jgi:hypothetical protein
MGIGYKLWSEEQALRALIENAKRAEASGFSTKASRSSS